MSRANHRLVPGESGQTTTALRALVALLVLLHGAAAFALPETFWGFSHLASWPPWLAVAWLLLAAAALLAAPRLRGDLTQLRQPRRRGALWIALAAGVVFWLLRERTHFFGDGYLLIRDRGFSETVTRAPLLVHSTARWVDVAQQRLGLQPETAMALVSVLAGVVAVYALLRTSAHLAVSSRDFWLVAMLLAGAGSVQLFFGHVEYYAVVAAAVLVDLALVTGALRELEHTGNLTLVRGAAPFVAYAALVPLHLSTLGLAPAHAYLAWRLMRAGRHAALAVGLAAAPLTLWLATRVGGQAATTLWSTSWSGLQRYTEPFFATESAWHTFGLFAPAHFLALANDVLLAAPLVLVGILGLRGHEASGPVGRAQFWFLALASFGCLTLNFLFARDLGPYRDWDILAPYGFVLLAWSAVAFLRTRVDRGEALVLFAVVALAHTLPWVALHLRPAWTLRHVETVLTSSSQWSPLARASMYETLGNYHRDRGDENSAMSAFEAAVQAHPADARSRVGLGNRYIKRGEFAAAAREYAKALEVRPDYAPAHNNLAFALASLSTDLDRAREHAHTALRLAPHNADFWLTLARVEFAAQQPKAGRIALQRALELRQPFPAAEELLRSLE